MPRHEDVELDLDDDGAEDLMQAYVGGIDGLRRYLSEQFEIDLTLDTVANIASGDRLTAEKIAQLDPGPDCRDQLARTLSRLGYAWA